MNILVSNDDGIFAEGIKHLANTLRKMGKITVVAPDMEMSATGHAITMHSPLRVKKINWSHTTVEAYAVNGTPADCVKIGVDILMDDRPDIIFSGINRGANLGTDIVYSGTVSAAMEGCLLGIPSIAVSLAGFDDVDFSYAAETAYLLGTKLMENEFPNDMLFNVNVPNTSRDEIKGIKFTKLGIRKYKEGYIEREDPRGNPYYWLTGEIDNDHMVDDTDINAVYNKYVSITPIQYDLTNYKMLDILKESSVLDEGHKYNFDD